MQVGALLYGRLVLFHRNAVHVGVSVVPLDPNWLAKVTPTAHDFAHSSKYIATLFYSGLMAPAKVSTLV